MVANPLRAQVVEGGEGDNLVGPPSTTSPPSHFVHRHASPEIFSYNNRQKDPFKTPLFSVVSVGSGVVPGDIA